MNSFIFVNSIGESILFLFYLQKDKQNGSCLLLISMLLDYIYKKQWQKDEIIDNEENIFLSVYS